MVNSCCVCKKSSYKWKELSFHLFPANAEKRKKWLSALNLHGDAKSWRVCSDHFTANDYKRAVVSGARGLVPGACPSQNVSQMQNVPENNESTQISQETSIESVDSCATEFLCDVNSENVTTNDQDGETSSADENDMDQNNIAPAVPVKRKRTSNSPEDDKMFVDDKNFVNIRKVEDVKWDEVEHDPIKRKICWEVAVETIVQQRKENQKLKKRIRNLESNARRARALKQHLKRRNLSLLQDSSFSVDKYVRKRCVSSPT